MRNVYTPINFCHGGADTPIDLPPTRPCLHTPLEIETMTYEKKEMHLNLHNCGKFYILLIWLI